VDSGDSRISSSIPRGQWSVLSPTAPKIRVRIPLATKLLYEKTKINEKEAGFALMYKVRSS